MAHVKSEETSKWWRFDDEATSLMERGPVGESGDHGVASTTDKNGAPAKARPHLSPAFHLWWVRDLVAQIHSNSTSGERELVNG